MCGLVIAKRAPNRYFLHGSCVSLLASIGLTVGHGDVIEENAQARLRVALDKMTAGSPAKLLNVLAA